MSAAQIKILLENNELDLILFELDIAYKRIRLTQPLRATQILTLTQKLTGT